MLTYYRFHDGKLERFDEVTRERLDEFPQALHWIDLHSPTVKEASILEEVFHFHPLAIEDCLSDVNHPKLDDYEGYLFFVVHGIRFDAPRDVIETRELDIFLGANYLVSHHEGPMRSIEATLETCEKGIIASLPRGVDFLAHQILDQLFEHYFPNLDLIEDKLQLVQVEVFEDPTPATLDRIFTMRKDVMHLRRISLPQREIVNRLARGDFKVISPRAAVYFRDIYDNLYRMVEASYQYHDMVQGTLDAYLSAINNRLNETMKRLTLVNAVIAPIMVVTGIYGMNFVHLPELHWRFGYLWAYALMFGVSGGMYLLFKSKRWI